MSVIKKNTSDLNQVSQTRIQQINDAANTIANSELTEKAETSVEKPVKQKDEQINLKLPQNVKTKWKMFFVENNINITQGIIFAVENLIQEVKDGESTLTMGGVYKKK